MSKLSHPITAPWVFSLKTRTGRIFSFCLSFVDAWISYRGLVLSQVGQLEAIVVAALIFFTQTLSMSIILGGNVTIASLENKFFSARGIIGLVQRMIFLLILLAFFGLYGIDIFTNMLAFQNSTLEPVLAFGISVALSLGDEIIAVQVDTLAPSEAKNEQAFRQANDSARINVIYGQNYYQSASKAARSKGLAAGKRWEK